MLELKNINGGYRKGQNVLNDITISVKKGEILAIIGQNGAGKSTIAKAIVGMLPYLNGEVLYNGINIIKKDTTEIIRSGIGYFIQGGKVFPHLTVNENLLFASNSWDSKENSKKIEELSIYFSLFDTDKLKTQASHLSGGEKHQLALAMVLLLEPKFLILDEPSAGLSPQNTSTIYNILSKYNSEKKISILLIEQNINKAIEFSDNIAIINNGRVMGIHKSSTPQLNKKISNYLFD